MFVSREELEELLTDDDRIIIFENSNATFYPRRTFVVPPFHLGFLSICRIYFVTAGASLTDVLPSPK